MRTLVAFRNGLPSEESPLLAPYDSEYRSEAGSTSRSQRTPWIFPFRIHLAYMIIPVFFGVRFVAVISTTPTIEIFRLVVCRWWLAAHDPESLPRDGTNPSDEQCRIPGVEELFSVAVTVDSVVGALGGIITCGIISNLAKRYGRKPVLLVLINLTAISTACFLGAVNVAAGSMQDFLLFAWIIIGAFSSPTALLLVCNMYMVDTTEPKERTSILSIGAGFAALGTAPTYWLGGYISRHSSAVVVFWCKLVTVIIIVLYVLLILPESFSAEKREAARRETELHSSASSSGSRSRVASILHRPIDGIKSVLEPLSHLKPSHNPITGQLNVRLLIISLSQAFTSLGADYVGAAFVIYVTVRFNVKTDELGTALSAFAFSQVIWLSVFFPAILHWGRPFYNRHWSKTHGLAEGSTGGRHDSQVEESSPRSSPSISDPDMASHFDVYVAIASSLAWTLAIIFVALAPSRATMIVALMLVSLGTGHEPSIKSVAVASSDPLHSGQVLSALAIISSVASLLGQLVLGTVLSLTITKIPQPVFFICSAVIAIGAVLLFLVRDSDRYIKLSADEE